MRPTIRRVTRYQWYNRGKETPGIAIMGQHGIIAHMTPTEALQVANDIADTLEHMKSTERQNND